MTTWDPDDGEVDAALAALRVHDAPPGRVERIRARGLAVLEARRREEEVGRDALSGWRRWLEPAFALGLGLLFLAEALARALAVYAVR